MAMPFDSGFVIEIKPPLVVVVGAGGSVPYGLPSGEGLRKQIWNLDPSPIEGSTYLDRSNNLVLAVERMLDKDCSGEFNTSKSIDIIRDFQFKFKSSQSESIDDYLQDNPEQNPIGRLAIAHLIAPLEHNALRSGLALESGAWIDLLINRIAKSTRIALEDTTFITFNYDRLLSLGVEQMLRSRLAPYKNLPTQPTSIHVYGNLCNQAVWSESRYRYETGIAPEDIIEASNGIKIISSERDAAVDKNIQIKMRQAATILFMGFGYDSVNLSRLGIVPKAKSLAANITSGVLPKKQSALGAFMDSKVQIAGTAYRLGIGKMKSAVELFGEQGARIRLTSPSNNCVDFINDTLIF